ncbi:peptidylprolyl isomerase [Frigoriflavimonas asaccharolytica]|uniref:Peptidyl-prolyl cis-trans isomerase SurA n=1 Tax=Frigoriflavimonas asaccharolytica TaxID=2735899 RepID=A0A8J8G5R3_9FLAO|nr:peptidylprolyl isomerase [Frigoriflavimonas asaccharolytica]NRS91734.1 peptidyl-prolyl cis-trans isomerase SurA [Frigoriflavimonas asaccharolytica]
MKRIYIHSFLILIFSFSSIFSFAQISKGQMIDGIAVVVGNEIILDSDISEQMAYAKEQGGEVGNKCEFLEGILSNKLLIYEAKKDTLIENRTAAIKENSAQKYNQLLSNFPDEKTMLKQYSFRTKYEMQNVIEKADIDQYYSQQKFQRITDKADVTPNMVTDFYKENELKFPEVKDELTLAQIVQYPVLTDAHKKEIIDRLLKIKADIIAGESFESQARIYSEDPGSAAKGGAMKNITKGQMVKPFEASALNLQEGEISDPVESEFGYHLIKLDRKAGKIYDASHILIMAVPTEAEISTAKAKLDSIKGLIETGKFTFKDAAFKFSDDKATKFNAGIIQAQDGSSRIEKETLEANAAYQIAGVNKGDITEAFEDELNRRKAVKIIKVEGEFPRHTLSLESDYDKVKQMALNKKKNEMLDKFVKEKLPEIFISIDNRYDNCNLKSKFAK